MPLIKKYIIFITSSVDFSCVEQNKKWSQLGFDVSLIPVISPETHYSNLLVIGSDLVQQRNWAL